MQKAPPTAKVQNKNKLHMAWIILIIAGIFETAFAFCLGKAEEYRVATGTISWLWLSLFLFTLSISMYLMYKCTQMLPLGVVYPVWTGIGAVGTALLGFLYFNEPFTFWKAFFIVTLIGSVVGLKAVS